jgi:predicted nuclease of predicted toxin-antitoxin system
MKFLVDAQLPPALCGWLSAKDHAARHVMEWHSGMASDPDIAVYCTIERCILISKDDDFLAHQMQMDFKFVWLRIGNATNSKLFTWLAPRWPQIEKLLLAGETMIEVT